MAGTRFSAFVTSIAHAFNGRGNDDCADMVMTSEQFLLASLMVCGTFAMDPPLGSDPMSGIGADTTGRTQSDGDDAQDALQRAILMSAMI